MSPLIYDFFVIKLKLFELKRRNTFEMIKIKLNPINNDDIIFNI